MSGSDVRSYGSMMKRLDIVIVNWNAGPLLEACIASILASRCESFVLGEVIVVDNGSTDGSVEQIAPAARQRIRLVMSEQNLGFGKASNLGASLGHGELLLFLNPDTRLFVDSLEGAVSAMHARGDGAPGVVGIRLIDDAGVTARSCARLPDLRSLVVTAIGLDRIGLRSFPGYVMTQWDHQQSRYVDHVIGAFYLIQRPLFEALGGFDERFFLYLEDLDLSQRVREHGFKTFYCADVCAYHMGGGSSRRILDRRLFYSLRSRLQYARKHLPPSHAVLVTAATLLLEPAIRLVRAVVTVRMSDAWNICRAYAMLYADLLGRAKARAVQGTV
jgi:N-acetylglucosaminyl-diphospho-decaprenol L-rhamnosyltransferase